MLLKSKNAWMTFAPFMLLLVFAAAAEGAVKKVFLLAGQSNAGGADAVIAGTGLQNLIDAGLQTAADQNTQFAFGQVFNASDPISKSWGPVIGHLGYHNSVPGYWVVGPEVGFERALYAAGVRDMAIIGVSNNIPYNPPAGAPWPWTNKDANSVSPAYYSQWTSYVNARLGELTSHGDTYTVAGFIWWEGIDDAINHATQSEYQTNLTRLISQLRADYGTPTTPFVLVRSKSEVPSEAANLIPIRAAQLAVAAADPYAIAVSCDDQPCVNTHHFSADSQLMVGERLGNAYLTLVVPEPSSVVLLLMAGMAICLLGRRAARLRR